LFYFTPFEKKAMKKLDNTHVFFLRDKTKKKGINFNAALKSIFQSVDI